MLRWSIDSASNESKSGRWRKTDCARHLGVGHFVTLQNVSAGRDVFFWTIWRCSLQQLWYLFRGFFFYTGVSTVVSGTWNHLYGRCSMLEKRGIFGIAMLDSQRCILGEVVPPSQEWLSWRLKVATPKIQCCLWWCLFWLLLGRGDNPTYNLYTWICVFDAGKQGKS